MTHAKRVKLLEKQLKFLGKSTLLPKTVTVQIPTPKKEHDMSKFTHVYTETKKPKHDRLKMLLQALQVWALSEDIPKHENEVFKDCKIILSHHNFKPHKKIKTELIVYAVFYAEVAHFTDTAKIQYSSDLEAKFSAIIENDTVHLELNKSKWVVPFEYEYDDDDDEDDEDDE